MMLAVKFARILVKVCKQRCESRDTWTKISTKIVSYVELQARATMLRSIPLFLIALTTSLLLGASLAAQCMPDPTNPCVTTCNGSTFDLTQVFDYPYVHMRVFSCSTHQLARQIAMKTTFVYSYTSIRIMNAYLLFPCTG